MSNTVISETDEITIRRLQTLLAGCSSSVAEWLAKFVHNYSYVNAIDLPCCQYVDIFTKQVVERKKQEPAPTIEKVALSEPAPQPTQPSQKYAFTMIPIAEAAKIKNATNPIGAKLYKGAIVNLNDDKPDRFFLVVKHGSKNFYAYEYDKMICAISKKLYTIPLSKIKDIAAMKTKL